MRRALTTSLAAAILAGCGSSATRQPPVTVTRTTTTPARATTSGSPATTTTTPPGGASPTSTTTSAFAGRVGLVRFRAVVNDICRVVRAGAPKPLAAGAAEAAIRSHAAAGSLAAQKTMTAFDRVQAPPTVLVRLRPLNAAYATLAGLYRSVLGPGAAPPSAYVAAVRLAEARAAAAARAAGVVACGPATQAR